MTFAIELHRWAGIDYDGRLFYKQLRLGWLTIAFARHSIGLFIRRNGERWERIMRSEVMGELVTIPHEGRVS